jgi:nucleoid DNA-binding protein
MERIYETSLLGSILTVESVDNAEAAMTLTKENLNQSLYDKCGLSKHQAKAVIDKVFEHIKKSLESGDDVLISGFGRFIVREKAQRKGEKPGDRWEFDPGQRKGGHVQALTGLEGFRLTRRSRELFLTPTIFTPM